MAVPNAQNIKYDWYQTDSKVCISILLKNYDKDSVQVEIKPKTVHLSAKLLSGDTYDLNLNLSDQVNPSTSTYKILSVKIEIVLSKIDSTRWSVLEGKPDIPEALPCPYNKMKNWDKIGEEIQKEEEDENKDSVDQLFKQIYSKGDDATKRAMNKSFSMSGGTCLSTNWEDLKNKEVEVKPPDCMEFRKWDS